MPGYGNYEGSSIGYGNYERSSIGYGNYERARIGYGNYDDASVGYGGVTNSDEIVRRKPQRELDALWDEMLGQG